MIEVKKMLSFPDHEKFRDASRVIANNIVADVKNSTDTSIRMIVNAYWNLLPRLKAGRAKRILELYKETDMGIMPTYYAELEIRDCIMDANSRNYYNVSEENEDAFRKQIIEVGLHFESQNSAEEE